MKTLLFVILINALVSWISISVYNKYLAGKKPNEVKTINVILWFVLLIVVYVLSIKAMYSAEMRSNGILDTLILVPATFIYGGGGFVVLVVVLIDAVLPLIIENFPYRIKLGPLKVITKEEAEKETLEAQRQKEDEAKQRRQDLEKRTEETIKKEQAQKAQEEQKKQKILYEKNTPKRLGFKDKESPVASQVSNALNQSDFDLFKSIGTSVDELVVDPECDLDKLPSSVVDKVMLTNKEFKRRYENEMIGCDMWFETTSRNLNKLYSSLESVRDGLNKISGKTFTSNADVAKTLIYDSNYSDGDDVNSLIQAIKFRNNKFEIDKALEWCEKAKTLAERYKNECTNVTVDYNKYLKGDEGEKEVRDYCARFKYPFFTNANIPFRSGQTAENDLIWIRPEGVFTVEIKNYRNAEVSVDEDRNVVIKSMHNDLIGNDPIAQCENHVVGLRTLLNKHKKNDVGVYGAVVFANEETKINNKSDYPVVTFPFLNAYIEEHYVKKDYDLDEVFVILSGELKQDLEYEYYVVNVKENPFAKINAKVEGIVKLFNSENKLC